MKTKLHKSLKFLAGAAFIFALALNVIVTLDDPFLFMSDVAIATDETGSGTGLLPQTSEDIECPRDQWTTVFPDGERFTITVSSAISFAVAVPGNFTQVSADVDGTQVTYTYIAGTHTGILTETYKRICHEELGWGCSVLSCRIMD